MQNIVPFGAAFLRRKLFKYFPIYDHYVKVSVPGVGPAAIYDPRVFI